MEDERETYRNKFPVPAGGTLSERSEGTWEEKEAGGEAARGQDRYFDSKVDLEEKDSAAKEMSDCFVEV